ncbi:MAG TPA: outer membrane beta-barrel protein [Rhizobiaceae bacterium]|nr:outer membrane beta-barrel protein [Rhizobiaceae bacterium]
MIKRIVFLSAALGFSVSIGHAADMIPVEPVVSAPGWSGCYAGVHAGYGHGQTAGLHDGDDSSDFNDLGDLNPEGWLGGGQVGCNWQMDSLVFGVEGDITATSLDDSMPHNDQPDEDFLEAEVDWLASLRGRMGFASGSFLVYGTGGVAWARHSLTDTDDSSTPPPSPSSIEFTDHGWVAGAGVEYMMANNWIFRGEYLHYGFSETHSFGSSDLPDGDEGDSYSLEDVDVIRVGLSYKF